jgi:Tfp pilus assembly protein FimT
VLVILSVVTVLAVPSFVSLLNGYQLNDTARKLQALATLAHVKAAARNTRYQLAINTTTSQFTLQYCTDAVTSRMNPCSAWGKDETSETQSLPKSVTFSTTGLTTSPSVVTCSSAPCAPTQATEMTFNSRGILFDESANSSADSRCFYLAGKSGTPIAICSVLTGRTTVYTLSGTNWIPL